MKCVTYGSILREMRVGWFVINEYILALATNSVIMLPIDLIAKLKISLISIVLFVLTISCSESSMEDPDPVNTDMDVLVRLENKNWQFASESCSENSFQFVIRSETSLDVIYRNAIIVDNRDPQRVFPYTITSISDNVIQTKMQDEFRFDSNNMLIGWDIIIEDDNTFYWRVTDTNQRFGPVDVCE